MAIISEYFNIYSPTRNRRHGKFMFDCICDCKPSFDPETMIPHQPFAFASGACLDGSFEKNLSITVDLNLQARIADSVSILTSLTSADLWKLQYTATH